MYRRLCPPSLKLRFGKTRPNTSRARMSTQKNPLRYRQPALLFLEKFKRLRVKLSPEISNGKKSSQTPHPVLKRQKLRKTQSEFQSGSLIDSTSYLGNSPLS